VAEAMSQWASAFFATQGARHGMSAEEMYQRYPLRILAQAGVQQPANTLVDQGADQTQTPEFKGFFEGSQVVDEAGAPLRVFTGTSKDADFTTFRAPKNGVWFTDDAAGASQYAVENDSMGLEYVGGRFVEKNAAARVLPVYLSIKNPKRYTEWPDSIRLAENYRKAQGVLFDQLKAEGYDGVFFDGADGKVFVAFDPKQIKSAIGNRGTFDPNSGNILRQAVSPGYNLQTEALQQTIEAAGGVVQDMLQIDQLISSNDVPTITLQDLVGLDIFPTIADRTAAAALYTGIDSSQIDMAIPLLGGPLFPLRKSNVAAGVVWTNRGKGVVTQKAAKVKAGANYMLVTLGDADMHQSNSTTAAATMATLEAWQRDGRISAEQIDALGDMVRNAPSNDAKIKAYLEGFPGFDDAAVMHAYMDGMSFDARKRVLELLASKEAQSHGAPPMNQILDAIREPSLAGHRWGDGVLLIEIDQENTQVELGTEGTTPHPDYPLGIRGKVVGKLNAPINWQTLWQDWLRENTGPSPRRAFELAKPIVSVTQDLVDRIGPIQNQNIDSARQARLASDFVADNWRVTGVPVNKGGASPQEFVDAVLTSAARPVLSEYSVEEVKQGAKDGSFKAFQLGTDGRIFFGLKRGDPGYAADYGQEFPGIGPDEVSLVSVINNEQGARGIAAPAVVLKALMEGATVLDCFAVKSDKYPRGFLVELYEEFGFQAVGEPVPFNAAYYSDQKLADAVKFWKDSTPGYDPVTHGHPPLVVMKWKGSDADRANIIERYLRHGTGGLLEGRARGDVQADFDVVSGVVAPQARDAGQAPDAQRDAGQQGDGGRVSVASRARGTVQGIADLSEGELANLGITVADRSAARRGLGRPDPSDAAARAAARTGVLEQKTVAQGRIRRTLNELVAAAESQKDWKDWYNRHEQALVNLFGDDAPLFQKILSATSQATGVKGNVTLALKAYDQLLSGKPFEGYLPAVIGNLERIRADQAIEGAKIGQYGEANEGNVDAIAVDRHIAMLFFNTKSPSKKQIESAKDRIRKIADRLGWEPRQVQAALWAFNQVRLGTDPTQVQSYDTILEARADLIAELRARHQRGEGGSVSPGGDAVQGGEGGLDQEPADAFEQTARGTYNPSTLELVLNPNANLSTWFHETGHFYLEVMSDLAGKPGAPPQAAADWQKILDWFGVKDAATWDAMTLDQQRKYHERWAESIEQYVMEGKSPSLEMAPVMQRFSTWLKSVYSSIRSFLAGRPDADKMPLNDSIRGVMDRMLATDGQIQQANKVAGMLPDEEADEAAANRLRKRSIADLKYTVRLRDKAIKALQDQVKKIRDEVRAAVTAEVDQTPAMRAKAALDALAKAPPEVQAAMVTWREQRKQAAEAERQRLVLELYAANPDIKGLQKGQLRAKNKRAIENQVDAYLIGWDKDNPKPAKVDMTEAEIGGVLDAVNDGSTEDQQFASVEEMMSAINEFGNRKDAIDAMVERRMLEEHGELVGEDNINNAANDAVHNQVRARALATELRTQQEMMSTRTPTGNVNAAGRQTTVNALVEAARQFGERVVGRTLVGQLKATAWKYTSAERRAAKRHTELTAAGKTAEAVQAKKEQVLNNAAANAAVAGKAEVVKMTDLFRRVLKGSDETVVEKGRDPDIVNAARAVLAEYGMGGPTTKSSREYLALVKEHDPDSYQAIEQMVDEATQNAQPIESLTLDEMRGLYEQIEGMWFLAKASRESEVAGDRMDIQEQADELHARMVVLGIPDTVPGEKGAPTPREKAGKVLQFFASALRRAEQWAEGMGPEFTKYIYSPIKRAADAYRTDRADLRKGFKALVDKIAPSMKKGIIKAPELGGYEFGRGNGMGISELLHAVLHTGNDSNKRKLLLGRGWAKENPDGTLDTTQWDAFIDRMVAEGVLTKEHFDFAQGVWDLLETTKDKAQKAHRQVYGRYFSEVTADGFVDPFGVQRRGGYVPAQGDPELAEDADMHELIEQENQSMSASFPMPARGFTMSRTKVNRPLKLDLMSLPQHLDKVALFSNMAPAVQGVQRLLNNKGVKQALKRIDPTIQAGMLKPWLKRSGTQQVETPVPGDGGTMRMLSMMRLRAGMALMFANVSNTVQQISGVASAAVKVKPSNLMKAAASYLAHPKQVSKAVSTMSPYMHDRMTNEIASMNNAIEEILVNPTMYKQGQAWAQKHAYFLQSAVDNVLSPIVWMGAYNESIQDGKTDAEAIDYADGVVRTTQGSTLPEDVSRIETGPAYARMFTQFIGYFNMMSNTSATALKRIQQETGLKRGFGQALYVVMAGTLVPLWIAEAIALMFRGGPGDEDDDGWYLDDWVSSVFGMGTLKGLLAQIPFVGQAANVAINTWNDNPSDDRASLSPAVSLLEEGMRSPRSVYKAVTGDGSKTKAIRDVSSLLSMLTGLPFRAAARPVGYLAGVADDSVDPTSAADAARGVVTGVASKESRQ
jgi:hypothetical protein